GLNISDNPPLFPGSADFKRGVWANPPGAPATFPNGNGPSPAAVAAAALSWVQACESMPGTQQDGWSWLSQWGWIPAWRWTVFPQNYTHYATPNKLSCANSNDYSGYPWGGPSAAAPPTSNHPGGVNMGFCDGSVKFIKDSIGIQTFWALGTKSGGEVIGSD